MSIIQKLLSEIHLLTTEIENIPRREAANAWVIEMHEELLARRLLVLMLLMRTFETAQIGVADSLPWSWSRIVTLLKQINQRACP